MSSTNQYRVDSKKFLLKNYKTNDKSERSASKEQDTLLLTALATEINALQDILHAEGKRKVLLILQGMDASGKDGTVRHVFRECDPLGIRLASFKAPSIASVPLLVKNTLSSSDADASFFAASTAGTL